MKKTVLFVCVALVALTFVASFSPTIAVALSEVNLDDTLFDFMTEFVTANPIRNTDERELAAASWLKTKFEQVLPQGSAVNIDPVRSGEEIAYNVVATLKGDSSDGKQIIVGAHYDSVDGQGVSDNACGVATLYGIAQRVCQSWQILSRKTDFDVVFVAFGGEERGFVGSQGMVDKMSETQRANTLLMINVDSIAMGDQLFVACENKPTDVADFIVGLSGGNVLQKPFGKGVYTGIDVFGYGYYETIQGSDHTPFRLAGVPTAFLFAGNYDGVEYVESSNPEHCVMNTAADSLVLANANKQQYTQHMSCVADLVASALLNVEFGSIAANARNQIVNLQLAYGRVWQTVAGVAIVVVASLLFVPYYRKLQKQSIMGTAEIKQSRVFTTPDAKDIFDI